MKPFIGLLFVLSTLSCGSGGGSEDSICPRCDAEISFDRYGDLEIFGEGGDQIAHEIVECTGWKKDPEHQGGPEDTFQAEGCVEHGARTAELVWAYNDFGGFLVTRGWRGYTSEGIQMGDSKQHFFDAYHGFRPTSCDKGCELETYVRGVDQHRVVAGFDEDGRLALLIVGSYRE